MVGTLVAEGVAVAPNSVSTINCGALVADSRLARVNAVPLVVVRAKLTSLLPVISGVTSTVVQALAPKPPDVPVTFPIAGILA